MEEDKMKVKGIIVGASILILLFGFSETLFTQETKFELNKGYGMKEILASYEGKRIAVRLEGGEELEGTLTTVGEQLVHISRLSKRDFYDAVVRIDRINAVIFRARSN
jgi:small nuclear ribonucleoprotein (snRNP)-like protein